ncbi:MAG: ATP-dependent DNA helicase UvrD2 [Actinomycetota bacterium]|nr:ATP-dependent DNA helicase UvrD2 [Actinomycetota bacterium]
MDRDAIFAGLNEQQGEAVGAVAGPVCILAGAGTGKTATITRRIANQVVTGSFDASSILPVTFTDKAAAEMRARLAALRIEGVKARTFHSAALQQLRYFSSEPPPQIMPSKVVALRQIANSLPKPYRFRPAADLATEIEWAKNRRVAPETYPSSLEGHDPPIPADLMTSVYERYERGKSERNLIDFEDLLELTIQMLLRDDLAREEFAARYHAFTVDEYQDVNLLQETLLRTWLDERDQLCVVGDDYQSIYGFTGATPHYLLEMPHRFVRTKVVRLEANYRSTPQVLEVANRLVPRLGGAEKMLRSVRDAGPACMLRTFSTQDAEMTFLVGRLRVLYEEGLSYDEMAILYRLNFRSEDYEEALARAGIPYQVRDGAFLSRQTARQMLASLKNKSSTSVRADVASIAARGGYLEILPDGLGEQEITRQNDLARFVRLADEFDDGTRTCGDFVTGIRSRFGTEGGRGINLLTYHRAKGLEFEAVFLPQLQDGELPFRRSKSDQAVAEERRLFYVGITRAKTHLAISWVNDGRRRASGFVAELRGARPEVSSSARSPLRPARKEGLVARVGLIVGLSGGFSGEIAAIDDKGVTVVLEGGAERTVEYGERVTAEGKTLPLVATEPTTSEPVLQALKKWRRGRATSDELPAFIVFHDSTLEEIAKRRPRSLEALSAIPGIGPTKLERYGAELVAVLKSTLSPGAGSVPGGDG